MSDQTVTFLGIPVEGDIIQGDKRTEQKPLSELAPLMQAALDDEAIVSFEWRQYTPYFNDGDPCVFNASEIWVRTIWDSKDAEGYTLEVFSTHPTLGNQRWGNRNYVPSGNEHYDAERLELCQALSNAIDSGHFDEVLLEAFGDHADITVTRDGITVDFYEHD